MKETFYFPGIDTQKSGVIGGLWTFPAGGCLGVQLLDSENDNRQLAPHVRMLRGLLMAQAWCLKAPKLAEAAAEFSQHYPVATRTQCTLKEFGPLPKEAGENKVAVFWFGVSLTAHTDHERYTALYHAICALPNQAKKSSVTLEQLKKILEVWRYNAEDGAERGIAPPDIKVDEDVFQQALQYWCDIYRNCIGL